VHFFLAGLDYFLGQHPEASLAGQLLKGMLYRTVFQ
jgi:hypothetical protein